MQDRAYAPCCYILAREREDGTYDAQDDANTILVQTDWDWPSIAGTFGWGMKLPGRTSKSRCDHSGTDGTVTCPDCGATAGDFITAAGAWLDENIGAMAEDPGYFG
jgi:hypothetical protein